MKNYILNIGKGMIFAGAISLASCTGWFDILSDDFLQKLPCARPTGRIDDPE